MRRWIVILSSFLASHSMEIENNSVPPDIDEDRVVAINIENQWATYKGTLVNTGRSLFTSN